MTATLDGLANDGLAGENENIPSSVEKLIGGSAADTLTAGTYPAIIDGGLGADVLRGGSAAPVPYPGPYYYEGTTPVAPFDTFKGSDSVGYQLSGSQYFPKTIDSPYVAPRPRNQ